MYYCNEKNIIIKFQQIVSLFQIFQQNYHFSRGIVISKKLFFIMPRCWFFRVINKIFSQATFSSFSNGKYYICKFSNDNRMILNKKCFWT
jgi:hypothetical protein